MNKSNKCFLINLILLSLFIIIVNAFESVTDTLNEGETKTYTLNGKNYEVTVWAITDTGTIYVKFGINNELIPTLKKGDSATLSDGATLTVIDVIPGESGDVTYDLVQFTLNSPEEESDSDNDGFIDNEDLCMDTTDKEPKEPIIYGCSCKQILDLKPGKNNFYSAPFNLIFSGFTRAIYS